MKIISFANGITQLIIAFALLSESALANPVDLCWKASSKPQQSHETSLIQDGEKKYFSYDSLSFGIKGGDGSGFVEINDVEIGIHEINYFKKDKGKSILKLRPDDLNMLLGEVTKIKHKSKSFYCLALPFTGLGSSGNFSKYKAVITIPKSTKTQKEVTGLIGSNHK
jgi:hypothetical protein